MIAIAIFEKNVIIRKDKNNLSINDFEKLKSVNLSDSIFIDKQNNIQILPLLSIDNLPEEYESIPLRQFAFTHTEEEAFASFRAKALYEWNKETNYCTNCSKKLINHKSFTAKECPSCKKIFFPRIDPCIIVLISKGDKILLVRHVNRNQDIYACIAGFVEAGESIENAVKREVKEEVGITIKNIVYKGSQSWPFPKQLMLGFTAEYESGELKLQKEEISEAIWFSKGECKASPPPGSIAYKLIHNLF